MPKSLLEYADWLEERKLLWPAPPKVTPARANSSLKPLLNIRAVTWSLYGTLLNISEGQLYLLHPQQVRMQIAMEKTITEFNMWNSMSRKPGAPWEYFLQQYTKLVEDKQLVASGKKGEPVEVNAAAVWKSLLEKLVKKDYTWDTELYGDIDEYAEKVAYFFHSNLQGVGAGSGAFQALQSVWGGAFTQAIIGDGQCFSLVQLTRALRAQGEISNLSNLISPLCNTLSYQEGVKQPAPSLFESSLRQFKKQGIAPKEIVHVTTRLRDDLAVAKKLGIKTALYTGDKAALQATAADMKDPASRPDRILTDLEQIRQLLGI